MSSIPAPRTPLSDRCERRGSAIVSLDLTWLPEGGGQRRHDLRAVWERPARDRARRRRLMPVARTLPRLSALGDRLPADAALAGRPDASCFEALFHNRRLLLRLEGGRAGQPSAVILDSKTLPSTG